ncbi:hypothetical protein BCR44DRAFT_1511991 [Catenaria anguillulae PL171]|uniref:Uncharacterized protein n=1 Tax=Catenaria anguillulae PL171 TaxID=765915 RepID=A0A1Y2HTB1_9FUNG|nr:hypothetical protein BCR44DRAFT_1511991 [Catenaria anguillulae PL171]
MNSNSLQSFGLMNHESLLDSKAENASRDSFVTPFPEPLPPGPQERRPGSRLETHQLIRNQSPATTDTTSPRPPPHLVTLISRARRVTDELTMLIAKQEESAAKLMDPSAGSNPSTPSYILSRTRASTCDGTVVTHSSSTVTSRQAALADWMSTQLAINKHHSSLTIANTMAILGSRMQAAKLTRALDASREMVTGLQSQLRELESQLQATSGEVAQTQEHNARLKSRVEELQKTCDEAIEHYNRDSQTLASSIVFLVCYLLTGLANPVMRLPLRLASMSRRRQRWSVFVMRVAVAVAAVVQVKGTVGGIVDWLVGMVGGTRE